MLARCLELGYDVTALVRDPTKLAMTPKNLKLIVGDALDAEAVGQTAAGQDAVIQCLGVGGYGDGRANTTVSRATGLIVEAMERSGVDRLIVMSNTGVGDSHNPWLMKHFIIPLFLKGLKSIMEDKERMEPLVTNSSLRWTIVRFPNIVERPPQRKLRTSRDGRGIGFSISLPEAAGFMVEQLSSDMFVRQAVSVSN